MNAVTRALIRTLSVLSGVAVAVGTLVMCVWALGVMILGVGTGYGDPVSSAEWMRSLDRSTANVLHSSAALAVTLVVTCAIAVIGAFFRWIGWAILGAVCSACLAIALVGVGTAGSQVDALADRAISAVGDRRAISPPPPEPPANNPHTVTETRDEMLRMLSASVAAAVQPVTTDGGSTPVIDDSQLRAVPCGETGSRLAASMTMKTGDNAASLAKILSTWDAAGYLPDRTMQDDIRYSTTLPIEKMSIRDTSTIDGYIHLTVASACALG